MNQRGEKKFETNTEVMNQRGEKDLETKTEGGEVQTGKNEKHDAPPIRSALKRCTSRSRGIQNT